MGRYTYLNGQRLIKSSQFQYELLHIFYQQNALPTWKKDIHTLYERAWMLNSSFLFLYKNKFSLNAATAFFLKCTNDPSSYITVPCLDLSFFSKSESKFLEKSKIIFSGLFAIPYFCGTLQNLYNFYWTKLDFKVLTLIPKKKSGVWKK